MPARPRVDLHLHTCYSDGRASPQELVEHAALLDLQTIAITDHDNARGSRQARPFAEQLGITLVPAVELTCRWDASQAPPGKSDIDVLGYFLDLDQPAFVDYEAKLLDDLDDRMEICCWYFSAGGYTITRQDVLQENPHYAGIHQLLLALMRKGYAANFKHAFELVDSVWKKVRPSAFTIDQVISIIRRTGGVPVLAHPTIVPWPSGWLNTQAVQALVEMGLEGIEIYHPRLNPEARQYFLALANQYDLLITGGSDDHGWPEGFPHMGSQEVTSEMVLKLEKKAQYLHQFDVSSSPSIP
jgi:3',5'-nucleoside bisphosphate phosphatase